MQIKTQDENLIESIEYHQNRINEYKSYISRLPYDIAHTNRQMALEEATRQRIKENEEIISELTARLQ